MKHKLKHLSKFCCKPANELEFEAVKMATKMSFFYWYEENCYPDDEYPYLVLEGSQVVGFKKAKELTEIPSLDFINKLRMTEEEAEKLEDDRVEFDIGNMNEKRHISSTVKEFVLQAVNDAKAELDINHCRKYGVTLKKDEPIILLQKMKTREEAEERAFELFPKVKYNSIKNIEALTQRQAYLQCWEDMQQDKQTCGFCVEPKEVEMIECPDCNGEGTWYNDTSRQCTRYRGDCCGG